MVDDAGILSPIYRLSECREDCSINIHLPANISIDLPPLNWTFQHDLPDLDCIGNETELGCIYQDQTSTESCNQQSLSMLRYCLQHGEPIAKWYVLPTEDTSKINLCTYNFNIALSPVITFTEVVHGLICHSGPVDRILALRCQTLGCIPYRGKLWWVQTLANSHYKNTVGEICGHILYLSCCLKRK